MLGPPCISSGTAGRTLPASNGRSASSGLGSPGAEARIRNAGGAPTGAPPAGSSARRAIGGGEWRILPTLDAAPLVAALDRTASGGRRVRQHRYGLPVTPGIVEGGTAIGVGVWVSVAVCASAASW